MRRYSRVRAETVAEATGSYTGCGSAGRTGWSDRPPLPGQPSCRKFFPKLPSQPLHPFLTAPVPLRQSFNQSQRWGRAQCQFCCPVDYCLLERLMRSFSWMSSASRCANARCSEIVAASSSPARTSNSPYFPGFYSPNSRCASSCSRPAQADGREGAMSVTACRKRFKSRSRSIPP